MNVRDNDHPLALVADPAGTVTVHGDYSARVTSEDDASVYECPACLKRFSTPSNLERHHNNNRMCRQWIGMGKAAITQTGRMWDLEKVRGSEKLTGTLIRSLLDNTSQRCVGCERYYECNSALNRHYKSSLVCDRIRALGVIDSMQHVILQSSDSVSNWASITASEK
jgi:hypothetical protein